MRFNFSSRVFIFILLLSPLAVTGNSQKAFALTPVADLTGNWSGFAQITITGGYCQFTGNVNAHVTQNGNQISGSFSVVTTSAKSSNPDVYECDYEAFTYSDSLSGTIDGSQITLYSSDATFSGWYASSGISLSISSADYSGSTQLSPTGFTPSPFEPKDEPIQPPPEDEEEYGGYSSWDEYCKAEYGSDTYYDASTNSCEYYEQDSDGDSIDDSVDECIGLLEDFYGENESDGCPEKDSDDDTIYDYEDSCLYDPEDFIGIEDGCPEEEEEEFTEEEFAEEEVEELTGDEDLGMVLDEFALESPIGEWTMSEEEMSLTETTPKFIEPPTPSVLKVTEETKPFFKALWDGKCDTLSHQYQLVTGNSGQLPIVCTGGTIALPAGEMIQFSAGDDFDVKLLKWGGEGLAVNYVSTTIPPVGAFMAVFEAAKSPIETIKALSLVIEKGEVELLGGAIKIKASCATGNCKFLKTEEEGGGFKLFDMPTDYNSLTKTVETVANHNSVYILVEYASAETQEKTPTALEEKVTTPSAKDGGCLIATATYGSELAPQVQFLREIRDNTVLSTTSGTSFMVAFNSFYYSFSPAVADLERQNPMFKETVKIAITPLLSSLSLLQYIDIDSEYEMLGYGIGIILLNIGMYFVVPALIIFKLKSGKKEK